MPGDILRRSPSALLFAPLALALLLSACNDDVGEPRAPGGSAAAAELVQSDADRAGADHEAALTTSAAAREFAADLYARLVAEEDGNVVLSPYSVAVALAMTRAGAEGETASQMDAVLHAALAGDLHAGFNTIERELNERPGEYPIGVEEDEVAELELAIANQLWGQQGFDFEAEFLDLLATYYGAGMRLVDFIEATEEARGLINEWVSEQTRERIPELIPEGVLDDMTRLVLTNAIYLNAPWMHRFEPDETAPAPFTRLDGSEVEVDMMGLGGHTRINYGEGADFEAVRLPYVGGGLSMIVVVPREDQYEAFEAGLDAAKIAEITGSLGDALVDLRMPRFEFRTQAGLKEVLSDLGMPVAFEPGEADFSRINRRLGEDLYLQDVVHEAFISVDEDGTEAAAATAVVVGVVSMPPVETELTVDRPFLFLVTDQETGAILFMGRVLDPTG